jgi:septum formation protein
VAVVGPASDISRSVVVRTEVEFVDLRPADLEWYLATGEPVGKAGGFSIQGRGGLFVRSLRGSFSNVVGLPLVETARLLGAATNPQIA